MSFSLSDFDYDLPDNYIAQEPAEPRDHSRLLVYDREDQSITDDHFYNLLDYLPTDTTLVMNNSKVEKCRLLFDNKEIFVLESLDQHRVRAMVRPGKKFKKGRKVTLRTAESEGGAESEEDSSGPNQPTPAKAVKNSDAATSPEKDEAQNPSADRDVSIIDPITATVDDIEEDGIRRLTLSHPLDHPILDNYRYTPFPPYLEQDESLADQYQTVFAKDRGSRAAPTAGLHFTEDLLQKIDRSDISREEITLHVGLGTFAPVKTEDIDEHDMHSEWFRLSQQTADHLNQAGHITSVGTTSVRVIETCRQNRDQFEPTSGETDIFIRPGFTFKAVDALITNFHLPKSTLLMLVAAFMGYEEMRRVYAHAIRENYRFYSFGDAMLIL